LRGNDGIAVEAAEVKIWRRSERKRLLAERLAMSLAARRAASRTIAEQVYVVLAARPGITVGAYWPFQGEFDPRPLIGRLIAEGWCAALPAVVDRKGPLEYRRWRPGEPLVAGIWDIPVPERREIAVPEAVLAPLVGFDRQCYRLGYGGGYFDRTLAALRPRPLAIGVGFELSRIETIYPQAFDIPMDLIVTETAPRRR
jgi:5-formyltetrahydrofolate cyclo-ligase